MKYIVRRIGLSKCPYTGQWIAVGVLLPGDAHEGCHAAEQTDIAMITDSLRRSAP